MEDAVLTVMTQCELWTDKVMNEDKVVSFPRSEAYKGEQQETMMVAEDSGTYNTN